MKEGFNTMHNTQKLSNSVTWVGAGDVRLALFENMFPLPHGVSYNSFIIEDEKTALLDTVDRSVHRQYIENVTHVLNGKPLDYLILSHMEPDHCDGIEDIVSRWPAVKLVGNTKTFQLLEQFYSGDLKANYYEVKDGDDLSLGSHNLKFFFAPMVHWPEVMFTYESTEQILFSADAFGTFGNIQGNLFADETDYADFYLNEARRYYANIVGKFGAPVQAILKKLADKPINIIASLHGPIFRTPAEIALILDKYQLWSTYTPEKQGVVIAYASMYGNTEAAVNILAKMLSEKGVQDIRMFDVSKTQASYIISDIFKYSNLVVASPTYNMGIYYGMEALLHEISALGIQNRNISIIGNGSWAPASAKKMTELVSAMKNTTIVGDVLDITSSVKETQLPLLEKLADDIITSLK